MNFSTWTDMLDLHGYGIYVWPAYAAVLAGLLLEPWLILRRARRARALALEQGHAAQFGHEGAAARRAVPLPGDDA